jgi:hypothetical protein
MREPGDPLKFIPTKIINKCKELKERNVYERTI